MGPIRRLLLATLVGAFALSKPAEASDTQLVSVNGIPITEADVTFRERTNPVVPKESGTQAKVRLDTLRQLIVEVAAESAAEAVLADNPELKRQVDTQRRQSMLAIAVEQKLAGIQVSDQEIDNFVKSNPQYFSQRQTFHFHEILVGTVLQADEVQMRAQLDKLQQAGDIPSDKIGQAFGWARVDGFGLSITNRWLGTEQIEPETYNRIQKLVARGQKVDVDCHPKMCRVIALHDAYPDPLDARSIRAAIARNLQNAKQQQVGKKAGEALLQNASVEFTDPELAREASAQWGRKQFVTAPRLYRWLWVAQLVLLGVTIALGYWLAMRPPLHAQKRAPRWSVRLSPKISQVLFGQGATVGASALLVSGVLAATFWIFVETSVLSYAQDLILVAGYAAMIGITIFAALRFSELSRLVLSKLRVSVFGVLVCEALILLLTF